MLPLVDCPLYPWQRKSASKFSKLTDSDKMLAHILDRVLSLVLRTLLVHA